MLKQYGHDCERGEKMAQSYTALTTGRVPGQLIRYAVPVVLTSLMQALYNLVDMLIVSRMLGPAGASAVNNSSQVMLVLTQIAIGLSNGGNVLVGQYFGAGDERRRQETTGSFFSLFALLGLLFSVLACTFSRSFLVFMGAPALEEAAAYLEISTLGLFFIFGYNALASALRAVGNSRAPMRFVMISTGLNVLLDLLFVGPFGWGTAGAAAATVLSQGLAFLLALFYLLCAGNLFSFCRENLRMRRKYILLIFKVGVPCAVQMTVAGISWLTVTYLINRYGVVYSAGNGFAVKIKDLSMMFITAMSTAASSMIAQNLGAGLYERAREILYTAMKLAAASATVMTLLIELTAPLLIGIFTPDPEVIAAGALNLRIEVLGQVFYAIFISYHALMIGAGHTWCVFGSSFANCILFRVVLAVSFEHFFGIVGVFAACAIAPSISVPIGMLYTHSNRWRRSLVGGEPM